MNILGPIVCLLIGVGFLYAQSKIPDKAYDIQPEFSPIGFGLLGITFIFIFIGWGCFLLQGN